jgi:hypothetical protein
MREEIIMTATKWMARTFVVGSLAAAVTLLSACAPEKPVAEPAKKPAPQPVSLGQIKSELLESKAQIQTTTDALTTLQKSTQADASANYNKFTEEYLKLQAKSDAVKARADDLKAKTSAYYALWSKQVDVENPDLKRQAVQQKSDAERVYNSIRSDMELARISFQPYMANLKDVGKYLQGNLSPASLQSVSDLATKATSQSKEVNGHIDAIIASIDKMAAATGEGAAQAGAAPATMPAK